jgi:hypothetical protein
VIFFFVLTIAKDIANDILSGTVVYDIIDDWSSKIRRIDTY